jgi:7-cyano-7-deazaguanine synthase in queuosine biosynthesis
MFSGGLDSTVALYYLLKNTNAKIYVHHVIMDTANGKHIEELNTCNKMISQFSKIRQFEFTTSKYSYFTDNVDRITKASRQDDLSVILFHAIRFCTIRNYLNINHIVIADSKHDKHKICDTFINKTIDAAYFNHWHGIKPTQIDVLKHFYDNKPISKELQLNVEKQLLPYIILPYEIHSTISKKEIIYKLSKLTINKNKMYYYLPNNIRSLVLSCRNSKNGIKCGSCFKCKQEKLYI